MELNNRKGLNIVKLVQKYALPAFVMGMITLGYLFAIFILNSAMFSTSGIMYYLNFLLMTCEYYLVISTYYKIVSTSPGYVPKDWLGQINEEETETILNIEKTHTDGSSRVCDQCSMLKPPRAHHSNMLKKCVLRMDHYCVWVSNCVGCMNHKYFFLFLFYLMFVAFQWYFYVGISFIKYYLYRDSFYILTFFMIFFFSVFIFPLTMVVTLFVGWQFYLIYTNQTSVEYHKNSLLMIKFRRAGKIKEFKNIYDIGMYENICQVLGSNPKYWLLPTKPEMDGYRYKTIPLEEVKQFQKICEEISNVKLQQVIYQGESED
eukprot:gene3926-7137_t